MVNNNRYKYFIQGAKAGMPIVMGYIPIAITFGVLAKQASLPTYEIVIMSLWIYTGAGQFMAVSMFAAAVGSMEIVLATGMLTMRHIVMELSFHNRYKQLSFPWKVGLSLGLTDESFAVISMKEGKNKEYIAGLMFAAYVSWSFGTFIGCLSSDIIPSWLSNSMEIGLYALFVALLIPALKKRASLVLITAASMGINWFLSQWINKGWAIVISIVTGAFIGVFVTGDDIE